MNDPKREILNQVASGTITAEEGAARLEALADDNPPAAPTPTAAATPVSGSIKQVRITSRLGNTEVIGDPSVTFVVAEGLHRARQDGDVMVIEQSLLTDEPSFEFSRPRGRLVVTGLPDFGRKLTVRMNPALALRSTVQAGNLSIKGVNGPISGDVQAGNCTIDGFVGPIDFSVAAGNLDASGRLDGGSSSVRCQMGEVNLNLDRTSNVRITAQSTMGKVEVTGVRDQVVGTGAGTLEISCTMGDVKVSVG